MTELAGRLADRLREESGEDIEILGLEPLPGGACQDNFRVELEIPGEGRRKMVLRSDANSSLPGSQSRAGEFRVIEAACEVGVQTPRARWLLPDLLRPGSSAYLMDWVEGTAIGRQLLKRPDLEAARARLPEQLAKELAKIHSINPRDEPELFDGAEDGWRKPPKSARAAIEEVLALQRATVAEMKEPHVALELALSWLEKNIPEGEEVVLVHGDFRVGNFMVDEAGLTAVLDWEFAHWGPPAEDLAWIAVRDWRFGRLDHPIGGLAKRRPFYEAYEAASGRKLSKESLLFWEVLGNVRWASGCVYQGERYLSGEQQDLELIAIARRSAEMEYEALRLIENGFEV